MNRASRKRSYFPVLDSVRLFAIAAIIAYHFVPHLLPGGFVGVDVFLVLSGFLITRSLVPRLSEGRRLNVPAFLMKRLLRLWLPLLFMLVLALAFINVAAPNFLYNARMTFFSSLFFFNNWWQIANGSSYFAAFVHPSAFTHLWYVALQMQLYIVFPFVLLISWRYVGKRQGAALVFFFLALFSVAAMALLFNPDGDPSRVYYGTDTRAAGFMLGAAFGLVWDPDHLRKRLTPQAQTILGDLLTGVGLLLLVFLSKTMMDQSTSTYRGGLFMASLISLLVIAGGTLGRGPLVSLLSMRPLVAGGQRTYSMYLWYYPVYAIGGQIPWLAKLPLLEVLMIILLAWLTYEVAEKRLYRATWAFLQAPKRPTWLNVEGGQSRPMQLVAIGLMLIMVVSASAGCVRAPAGENKTIAEMEAQIAENQRRIVEEKREAERQAKADIPDIPGLNRDVMLFAHECQVTFIGDSILLSASAPLLEAFPQSTIDGKVGRQLIQSSEVVESLKKEGKLADTVVVVLGSNGPFTDQQLKDFAELLGDRRIFFVNTNVPRPWKDQVNEALQAYVKDHDKTRFIDWAGAVSQHPEWLYEDATHCNPDGAKAFVNLVATFMYEDMDEYGREKKEKRDEAAKKKAAEKEKANQVDENKNEDKSADKPEAQKDKKTTDGAQAAPQKNQKDAKT